MNSRAAGAGTAGGPLLDLLCALELVAGLGRAHLRFSAPIRILFNVHKNDSQRVKLGDTVKDSWRGDLGSHFVGGERGAR